MRLNVKKSPQEHNYFHIYSRRRLAIRDIMILSDGVLFLLSALTSYYLRFGEIGSSFSMYSYIIPIWMLYFLFMLSSRAYTRLDLSILRFGIVRLTAATIFSFSVFFSVAYFTKSSAEISRLWMGYNIAICLTLLTTYRFIFGYALYRTGLLDKIKPAFAVVYSKSYSNFLKFVDSQAISHRINIVKKIETPFDRKHPTELRKFEEQIYQLRRSVPDVLIFALSDQDREQFSDHIVALSAMPSEILEFSTLSADASNLDFCSTNSNSNKFREWVIVAGLPFVRSAVKPLSARAWWIKRLEDIVLGTILLILLSPVMMVIALCIKATSPGPVLFRQLRHGFNGDEIQILKFRSMYARSCDTDVSGQIVQARRNDPRVTKFGSFIRRTSLDELPQLINVLKGEMSLVGPRPHATAQYELYQGKVDTYFSRHRVRPGITGWAQVNGWRGETDTDEKIQQRIACDLYYIRHWSIWFDLRILFLTMLSVLSNKNAF
ncbi:exopolysaccharide biosynthesis polyprenyl glycosylphosphotransferase [Thalassospira sp.]|uniref:exopolysaccharide biosynthesis polyprenyl glycosylphosphotransferase n=1 Tax=Thalassospira sp. TaxID=1912094 RepID=UPI00311E3A61